MIRCTRAVEFGWLGAAGRRAAVAASLGLALAATTAGAAPVPEGGRDIRITAREEQLDRFLEEVFRVLDVPVTLSPKLQAIASSKKVNGDFAQPADLLLQDLARTYQFVSYFDGAVVHLVSNSEIVSRSFALGADGAQQVLNIARELLMPDSRNTLRRSFGGTIIATGAPRFVQQIEEMTRQARVGDVVQRSVPSRQPLQDYRVFYLRYAWAQDTSVNFAGKQTVIPGVANILRSLVDQRPSTTGRSQPTPNTVPGMRDPSGRPRDYMPITVGRDGPGQVAQALMDASLTASELPANDTANSRSGNTARIEADPRLNAVIVRDTPDQMAKYQRLISALDVEPQSLEIEATIIDIDTDRMRELGINWRYNRGLNSVMLGSGSAANPTPDLRLNGTVDPTPFGLGGFASAILGNRNPFVLRISALQGEGAAKVVSSPQVVTLSNVEAVFDNSTTFYVKVAGQYQADLFNVTAGTNLRVTPHVFKDEGGGVRIKLLTQIEDGEVLNQQVSNVDNLPIVKRSSINTQALINEGESLLIGGLVRDSSSVTETKVPLLGDIPVVGNLFKTTNKAGARIERLFLITPRLASNRSTRDAQDKINQPLIPPPMPSQGLMPPEPAASQPGGERPAP